MPRRRSAALLPVALLILLAVATSPAQAQSYNLSWSALDPGNDWSAQIIQSVFPVSGPPSGSFATGNAATVIGKLIGTLTGFVSAIAMSFLCYNVIMQIHRGAETGRVLSNAMTSMFVVRLGVAAVLIYPLNSGFSAGQLIVVQTALWGAGMAKTVYNTAVQAIGPDSLTLAQPMIPGTKKIVSGLIQAELCRSLVNQASAQSGMVPAPTPATFADPVKGGYTTWAYTLSAGNGTGGPVCGTVTVRTPKSGSTSFSGVNMDMTNTQQQVLTNVLQNDIRPVADSVAQQFWMTKQQASLVPLQALLTSATADYTNQLTQAATAKMAELRAALDATQLRGGDQGQISNEVQLSSLGWTGAGSYYLEFARLNGQTLSLMSATPTVNTPSYSGLGPSLSSDLAPLITSAQAFMVKLNTYVQTTDGWDMPGGNADLFTGAVPAEGGSGTIESVFRNLRLNDRVLNAFTDAMSPTGSNWADPFGALSQLGHKMIVISMTAFGLAGLLASGTASTLGALGSLLTGNFAAAGTITVGHLLMGFLATPIFMGLTGILVPGLVLVFVLPMVPWVMWIAGVTGWLILVCEAVIVMPLWMLAHMTMEGEGLHGRAREGYSLMFSVLFRPTLMIFGLFLSYFIFAATSWLIRMSFGIAAGFVLQNGWLVTNVLGVMVLLCVFVLAHLVAALQSFRLISMIPHHAPRWLGLGSGGRVDMDQFANDAAIVGAAAGVKLIGAGARQGIGGATRGILGAARAAEAEPVVKQIAASGGQEHGMDSTLRAATDNPGFADEEA